MVGGGASSSPSKFVLLIWGSPPHAPALLPPHWSAEAGAVNTGQCTFTCSRLCCSSKSICIARGKPDLSVHSGSPIGTEGTVALWPFCAPGAIFSVVAMFEKLKQYFCARAERQARCPQAVPTGSSFRVERAECLTSVPKSGGFGD